MKRIHSLALLVLTLALLAVWPASARAQGEFSTVTGKEFDSAMPKDFYLEGNAIPTEKRNAAMLKTANGARLLFALLDTAGYSSQIKQKYIGMIIAEKKLSVCSISVGIGSYGFGLDRPPAASSQDAKFFVYNQAGEKVGECASKKDSSVKMPKPLAVEAGKEGAKLYLGRYWVEVK
jgi:hypothetical protein